MIEGINPGEVWCLKRIGSVAEYTIVDIAVLHDEINDGPIFMVVYKMLDTPNSPMYTLNHKKFLKKFKRKVFY